MIEVILLDYSLNNNQHILFICEKLPGQTTLRKRNKNYRFASLPERKVHQEIQKS